MATTAEPPAPSPAIEYAFLRNGLSGGPLIV
jgi:hypothetical protein